MAVRTRLVSMLQTLPICGAVSCTTPMAAAMPKLALATATGRATAASR